MVARTSFLAIQPGSRTWFPSCNEPTRSCKRERSGPSPTISSFASGCWPAKSLNARIASLYPLSAISLPAVASYAPTGTAVPLSTTGKVIKISGQDQDLKVTVMFEDGTWKKLLVKYAKMEVI